MIGAGTAGVTTVVARSAAMAAVVAGGVAAGPGLDSLEREGEERRALGLKLCPSRIFTMVGLEKERRWRGWEEESFKGEGVESK